MTRRLLVVVCLLLLASGQVSRAASVHTFTGASLYAGPGIDYGIAGSLEPGQSAIALAEYQGWMQVRTSGGQIGWVFGWTGPVRYDDAGVVGEVTVPSVHVRADPIPSAPVMTTMPRASQVRWLEQNGMWSRIRSEHGIEGWVVSQTLRLVTSAVPPVAYWPRPVTSAGQLPPPAVPAMPPYPVNSPPVGNKQVYVHSTVTAYDGGRDPRWYDPLETIDAGSSVPFLDAKEGWLKVLAPSGRMGWIPGTAVRFTEDDLLYEMESSQFTIRPVSDGPVVTILRRTAPGVLQLEVRSGSEMGEPLAEGNEVVIPTDTGESTAKRLPVMTTGARLLSVASGGVRISFERLPGWEVVERTAQRLVMAFRPQIEGTTFSEKEDRGVIRFRVRGYVEPRTQLVAPGRIRVIMPGAVLTGGEVPGGVTVRQTPDGVEADVNSLLPFALQRSDDGVELHLLRPGLTGKTVLIDPGHGGEDGGAYDHAVEVWERELNLQVALKLADALAAKGVRVLLTRSTDAAAAPGSAFDQRGPAVEYKRVDLAYRAWMSRELKPDVFLSIHHNSGASGAAGIETYYTQKMLNGERSERLAHTIHVALIEAQGLADRGHREEFFLVTRENESPAALLELAFLSDPTEGRLVATADFQASEVAAISKALDRYYTERTGSYGGEGGEAFGAMEADQRAAAGCGGSAQCILSGSG